MQPLNYFVDNTAPIDRLQEGYGSQLEDLATPQKLHLLGVLALQLQTIYLLGSQADDYRPADAWVDYNAPVQDMDILDACQLLHGATLRDLVGLIEALTAQIRHSL